MSLSKVLAKSETQAASFSIWTWVTCSISFDNNYYAKSTSLNNKFSTIL